jgi:DNA polymerase-1
LRKGISDTAIYDEAAVMERYGFAPKQMIDYKALRGDPSDNIKGVKGIGEKGATDLIKEFGSIDALYKAIHAGKGLENIKPRTLQLLVDQEDSARQSYHLATIVTNVPIDIEIPPYSFGAAESATAVEVFKQFEFKSLVEKLPKGYASSVIPEAIPTPSREGLSGIHPKSDNLDSGSEAGMTKPSIGKQDYQLLDTGQKLDKLVAKLERQKVFALDTESTSLSIIDAKLVGVSICYTSGEAYYIPASIALAHKSFVRLLESDTHKIGHNIKFDQHMLQNAGVVLGGIYFDTMIASYLLNAGTRQHGLDALAFNELGYQMQPIEDLIGKGKTAVTMDQVPVEKVSWYAAEDVDMTFRLYELFTPRLKSDELLSVFKDIEMPLVPVLEGMEREGILLDVPFLKKLSDEAEKTIYSLTKEIHALAEEEFNINSPTQLREILFTKLGLKAEFAKKTKTGFSTAAGELEKLLGQHPIVEKIMQYRELTKLQNTYLLSLPDMVNEKTKRIHTSYNQTIAATGRLSSVDPNLQNIPVKGEGLGAEIRKAFVAADGYKLLSLDYSQIELRVVAHVAQDQEMLRTFNAGEDIHTKTAVGIFGVEPDKVTKDMRRHAKTINFGILYGLSAFGLSYRIQELDHVNAKEYIEKYFQTYPGVKAYIEAIKQEVHANGFVKNELGRTRKFPEIKSSTAEIIGVSHGVSCKIVSDIHNLFLVYQNAVCFTKNRFYSRINILDFGRILLAFDKHRNKIHRTRSIQRHHSSDITQDGWLKVLRQSTHTRRFELEDSNRLSSTHQLICFLVIESDFVDIDRYPLLMLHELESGFDNGQVP